MVETTANLIEVVFIIDLRENGAVRGEWKDHKWTEIITTKYHITILFDTLPQGDIQVYTPTRDPNNLFACYEMKRGFDFMSSILDRRVFDEGKRTGESGAPYSGMIIEGIKYPERGFSAPRRVEFGVLLSLTRKEEGYCPVIYTRDLADTFVFFEVLLGKIGKTPCAKYVPMKKEITLDEWEHQMLSGLFGPKQIEDILKKYPEASFHDIEFALTSAIPVFARSKLSLSELKETGKEPNLKEFRWIYTKKGEVMNLEQIEGIGVQTIKKAIIRLTKNENACAFNEKYLEERIQEEKEEWQLNG